MAAPADWLASLLWQVNACKRNMNTFAFVGDLANHPEVSCVYHSEEAENQFLKGRPSHPDKRHSIVAT